MSRNQKFALFMALAIIGGIGIALSTFMVIGNIHTSPPGTMRIVAGTLVVTFAMGWAMFFTTRAHFAQDEFKRQREVSTSFWGGSLGIAASMPVFFFIAAGGFGPLATLHISPLILFVTGYLLSPFCWAIGAAGARLWLLHRDAQG